MATDVAPDGEVARCLLVAVIGAVEGACTHPNITATMRTFADDGLHVDGTIVCQFQHGREGFSLLGSKAVQQDEAVLQQFGDFFVTHLAVADNAVDIQHTGRLFGDVVLTAVALAGLYHVAATQGTATDYFLFHTLLFLDDLFTI